MAGAFHGELTLPNQAESLALARSFLEQLAEMAELCLQRLSTDLDFDYVEVENPFAKELLDYVRADYARVRANAPATEAS